MPVPTDPATHRPAADRVLTRWLTADLVPDPDQPRKAFAEDALDELARSLTQGQQVPLVTYRHPDDPRRLVIVDGERRWRAALRAVIQELEVIVLPARPTPAELLLTQVSVNQFREQLSAREESVAYRRLLGDLGLTQAELAHRLGVSPSKVSKALARERIAPHLLEQADRLEPAVLPLIAGLPADEQGEAVRYAATPTATGRRPTRDQVAAFLSAREAKPKPGPKAKALTLTVGGRAVRLAVRPDDTHDQLTEWLKAVIAFVQKNKNVPVPNLNLIAG